MSHNKRKATINLTPMYREYIAERLADMYEFKEFTQQAIVNEKEKFGREFDKATEGYSHDQKQEYFDWYGVDFVKIEDNFQRTSWKSFVVILFSIVEDSMNNLCTVMHHDKVQCEKENSLPVTKITYSDMQGTGTIRAKIYLQKVIGCELHVDKKPWSEIETLRKIRHTIVHNDGYINQDLEKDANFQKHLSSGNIKSVMASSLTIEQGYLDYILPQVEVFFNNITED